MKKLLFLSLITGSILMSCSKKNETTTPTQTGIQVQYSFHAENGDTFVMNYFDGTTGTAETIHSTIWSRTITLPANTRNAALFMSAGEAPPFASASNNATVTIQVNGKQVAMGTKNLTSTSDYAQANYSYTAN